MVKVEDVQAEERDDREGELARRRGVLVSMYCALPAYGSTAFWSVIEEPDMRLALPLEILVKCARAAVTCVDDEGRRRVLEAIFRRIHRSNEYWASSVLNSLPLQADERDALASDLYADLCECIIRAILDTKRLFWEENFQHCLSFERRHAYQSCLRRDGRCHNTYAKKHDRVPRVLLESLDRTVQQADGGSLELNVEDEVAQKALLAVEQADIPRLVLQLPNRLKSVVLLTYWEGSTEKETAKVLAITDRTVRNRLYAALKILHRKLEPEGGYTNG